MNREYWPAAQWQSAAPDVRKLHKEGFHKLNSVIEAEYSNIAGAVIVKNGYMVFENYYNGYGPEDTIHLASCTKSILSAVVGLALDKGFLKSIDQKVLDFFPEYDLQNQEDSKKDITLKHLLTMTAPYIYEQEPFQELCCSPDWVSFALDLLGGPKAPGTFLYSTAGAHLLSAIITRSTGMNALAFTNKYLFAPIGMNTLPDYEMTAAQSDAFFFGRHVKGWVKDPMGNSSGGWGLTLTLRDMACFGFLYLNHGMWENKQIISRKWIEESTAMTPNHYGYLWWLFEHNGIRSYCALGDGGNVICCIPGKDTVIAIASTLIMNPKDRLELIQNYIFPLLEDSQIHI